MLPQQKQGWTTLVDIEEFKKITWTYLTNIKMTWQYDGMAYLFRQASIPMYGKDCGTMKMNHPVMTMGIPQSKDKNFGVDIYVPVIQKKQAQKLIGDEARIKRCAELEAREGDSVHESFEKEARALKERNALKSTSYRRARRQALISSIVHH